jgi:Flp pilus assembly protein TadD
MADQAAARQRLSRLQGYLSVDPENETLRADVFYTALEAGVPEVAKTELERALEEKPGDPVWRHRRSTLLLATRRYDEAREALQELLDAGVNDPAIVHDLAFALFRSGHVERAAETVLPLLDVPELREGPAWPLWLRCMHRLEREVVALERFRAQLTVGGPSVDAIGVASLMAIDAGQLAEANVWSKTALQHAPDHLEALVARGTLALSAGALQEALQCYERALRVSPSDGRTWSGVALVRMAFGDLPGADEAFGRAVETMPEHVGTWIAHGWCRVLLNRPAEARRSFEEAVRRDRNLGECHGGLAVALARLGERDAAKRAIELALRLDPKGLGARYAEAVLEGKAEDPETVRKLSLMAARAVRPTR